MNKQIQISEIKNSQVLVRVNYDLPNLNTYDRIADSKSTVDLLLENQNRVILVTHWGRPSGEGVEFSTEKMVELVAKVLGRQVLYFNQFSSSLSKLEKLIQENPQAIVLLENARFHSSEQSKSASPGLVKLYCKIGNYLVDEAFAVSHRQEFTNFHLKQRIAWAMGLSFQKEVENLEGLINNPKKPIGLILGGSKLETKLPLILSLIGKVDKVMLAGLPAFTFLAAKKTLEKSSNDKLPEIGLAKVEGEFLDQCGQLLQEFPDKIILPTDFVYGTKDGKQLSDLAEYPLDIGPKTVNLFTAQIETCSTIFWNGTLGFYESELFKQATLQIGQALAASKAEVFLGGGDTVSALPENLKNNYKFVSMGGGAALDFLSTGKIKSQELLT